MEGETEKRVKGVRIQTLNYAMVMASAVLYVVLIYARIVCFHNIKAIAH